MRACKTLLFAALVTSASFFPVATIADEGPIYRGPISSSEATFVASIRQDLRRRFPRAQNAIAACYIPYSREDYAGTSSYANRNWTSDPTHPSQLWYDKQDNLLGADFSVPRPHGELRPSLWRVIARRWVELIGHVRWVAKDHTTGEMTYDGAIRNANWVRAAGSLADPSAETVVTVLGALEANDVVIVFEIPTIWELVVWINPNPNGAFATNNPNVTP